LCQLGRASLSVSCCSGCRETWRASSSNKRTGRFYFNRGLGFISQSAERSPPPFYAILCPLSAPSLPPAAPKQLAHLTPAHSHASGATAPGNPTPHSGDRPRSLRTERHSPYLVRRRQPRTRARHFTFSPLSGCTFPTTHHGRVRVDSSASSQPPCHRRQREPSTQWPTRPSPRSSRRGGGPGRPRPLPSGERQQQAFHSRPTGGAAGVREV
jgi:hypothetical protein